MLKANFPELDENSRLFLANYVVITSLGLSEIEFLLKDPHLEEIVINNSKEPVWVYHRKFGWLRTNISFDDENKIRHFLNDFLLVLYKNHKEKKAYNIAFRSAIQSDKMLLNAHKERLFDSFKDAAQVLRDKNEIFNQIPEERLIKFFIFFYNLINALIYHHLSVMKLFDTDDELTDYLSNLTFFSLQFLNKKKK